VARLREAHVSDEDIGAVVGHSVTGKLKVTAGYGGDQGLERKLATLRKLDHGIDFVELLGLFNAKMHRA
jgi:hypothetical protein